MPGSRSTFGLVHACEFTILSMLGVEMVQTPALMTMQAEKIAAERMERELPLKKCETAAKLITEACGNLKGARAYVFRSARGRNYYDIILSKDGYEIGIEIWNFSDRASSMRDMQRLRFYNLFNILCKHIEDTSEFTERWERLQEIISTHDKWSDFDIRGDVLIPTRELVMDMAQVLHSQGTGLLPVLWDYYYKVPVLRVLFIGNDVSMHYVNPASLDRQGYTMHKIDHEPEFLEMIPPACLSVRIRSEDTITGSLSLMVYIKFDVSMMEGTVWDGAPQKSGLLLY